MMRFLIPTIFFFSIFGYSQQASDSLIKKSFDELFDLYNNELDAKKSLKYAEAYLIKAKKKQDTSKILTGYHIKALLYDEEYQMVYFDSIIDLTKNKSNKIYPASTYMSKGNFFYNKRDFKNALDYYLKAKSSAEKNYNPNLIVSVNYSIGMIRDRTKDSINALNIHRENYNFVKKNTSEFSSTIVLNTLYALANAYNNTRKLDSARYFNKTGLSKAIAFEDNQNTHLFLLNTGTTEYYLKNYGSALYNLKQAGDYFRKNDDYPNLSESLYFLGKSNLKINEKEIAIKNFEEIDTIFYKTNDILPRLRDSYKLLINHFKQKNDLNKELFYLNRLIKLDSIITSNEIYLNKTLIRKYEIPKIIAEKEAVINALENNNSNNKRIIFSVIVILFAVLILLYIQYSKRGKYKARFESILKESSKVKPVDNNEKDNSNKDEKVNIINVPADIISNILKHLDEFEKNNKFLDSNIKIQKMASEFKTNTNYLSKIINHYKEQNFATYINSLRIDYILIELQTNKTYRKFTIKALAREIGFKSAESFSKAFYKKTGIKPSYYIKELEAKKI